MSSNKTPVAPTLLPLDLADGSQTAVSIFTSNCATPNAPVILIFPAMGVRAAYYYALAQAIADKGYHVITADLRGLGHSSVRASRHNDFGYYDILTFDLPAIVAAAQEHFVKHPIYLMGHSLGGHFSVLYAALHSHSKQLNGLIFVAAGYPYYKSWGKRRAPLMWLTTQGFYALSKIIGYFPGKFIGFGGREARTLMRDWSYLARTGNFKLTNSEHDFEALITTIELPVLSISLEGDNFAPPAAVEGFNAKFKKAALTHLHLIPKTGENFNHFSWVKKNTAVVDSIVNWMLK
ncbi:MAG: alpha/beta fold hydrolase [Chitinophagales bacterium]